MAEETEKTAAPAVDEAPPSTNGNSKPERKQRDEGPPIEELFDLTKPIPKVSPWTRLVLLLHVRLVVFVCERDAVSD